MVPQYREPRAASRPGWVIRARGQHLLDLSHTPLRDGVQVGAVGDLLQAAVQPAGRRGVPAGHPHRTDERPLVLGLGDAQVPAGPGRPPCGCARSGRARRTAAAAGTRPPPAAGWSSRTRSRRAAHARPSSPRRRWPTAGAGTAASCSSGSANTGAGTNFWWLRSPNRPSSSSQAASGLCAPRVRWNGAGSRTVVRPGSARPGRPTPPSAGSACTAPASSVHRNGCRAASDPRPTSWASSTMRSCGSGTGRVGAGTRRGHPDPVADRQLAQRAPAVDGEEGVVGGGLHGAPGGHPDPEHLLDPAREHRGHRARHQPHALVQRPELHVPLAARPAARPASPRRRCRRAAAGCRR